MTDFDAIYQYLYELQKRIYELETIHPNLTEEDYMTKIINYTINKVDTNIIASTADNTDITQYQEIIIRAKLNGFEGLNKKALKLQVSSPGYQATEDKPYEYTNHLAPVVGIDTFEIRLNEILGSSLEVGVLNTCSMRFIVNDGNIKYLSNPLNVKLYKTNLDTDYIPDDLSNMFIVISQLNNRLIELERMVEDD